MNSLPEGIQLEILLKLDYLDIINTVNVFPIFLNTYRNSYFWLRKAELDFNISPQELQFIPGKDNKARYEWLIDKTPNEGLYEASVMGSLPLVRYFISRGANNYNRCLTPAARGGHLEIVKLMLDKGATEYRFASICAAQNGYIEIIKLLLEKGFNDYDLIAYHASQRCHLDINNLMVSKGAFKFNHFYLNIAALTAVFLSLYLAN